MEHTLFCLTDAIAETARLADDPNKRNISKFLGQFSSVSDVDSFLSRFNHANNYNDGATKLCVGDTIIIKDGTYNREWLIAGFDLEYNRAATDGTVYNNGYGIMLYPAWCNISGYSGYWNTNNTTSGGYKSSLAHSNTNQIAINMKNSILGTHLINRNVLLSSSIDSNGFANNYTWTTAYGTLPSLGQLIGGSYIYTIYDSGEANYKFPVFNYMEIGMRNSIYDFWTRNIGNKVNSDYGVFYIDGNGFYNGIATNHTSKVYHPVMYIR